MKPRNADGDAISLDEYLSPVRDPEVVDAAADAIAEEGLEAHREERHS